MWWAPGRGLGKNEGGRPQTQRELNESAVKNGLRLAIQAK